jgi:hypothetical protein
MYACYSMLHLKFLTSSLYSLILDVLTCSPIQIYEHGSLHMLIKTQGDACYMLNACALCFLRRFFYFACTLNDQKAFYVTLKEVFSTWQCYMLTFKL